MLCSGQTRYNKSKKLLIKASFIRFAKATQVCDGLEVRSLIATTTSENGFILSDLAFLSKDAGLFGFGEDQRQQRYERFSSDFQKILHSIFAGGFTSIKIFQYTQIFRLSGIKMTLGLTGEVKTGYIVEAGRSRENRLHTIVQKILFLEWNSLHCNWYAGQQIWQALYEFFAGICICV